ncbi:hypothetical protein [Laspinema olomoucense]|nr:MULTISPECIES: hypothetical protein [unclassified Laspinema]
MARLTQKKELALAAIKTVSGILAVAIALNKFMTARDRVQSASV